MTNDAELLRRFVDAQSNADFTELVRRHIDVVYHAALRRTGGRTDLAADIAQEVFMLLARKAPQLTNHPLLPGWLYTTTRNLAGAVVRKEMRRQLHEQEACKMNSQENQPPSDWSSVRLTLDHALDELATRDREAILLRFFHNKTYADVGTALGLTEDAARKRVDRALDDLHLYLGRRGLTSTATALAAFLAGEAALAAPASLAATVAQTALATGTASLPTIVVAKLMSIKTSLAVVGLLGLVGAAAYIGINTPRPAPDADKPAATTEKTSSPASTNAMSPKQPATAKTPEPTATTKQTITGSLSGQGVSASGGTSEVVLLADNTLLDQKHKFGAQLPAGWTVRQAERWGTNETTVFMRDPEHPDARPSVYYQMFSEPMQPLDTSMADAWMRDQVGKKAKARLASGFTDYANGEVTSRTIGDRPAVTWTAEYTKNGEPWGEYLTRVYSNNCTVLFFMNAPKKDLPAMIPNFESVIQTTVVP